MNDDMMGEVYDEKGQRYRHAHRPNQGFCEQCKCFGGHTTNCAAVPLTPALAAHKIDQLLEDAEWARKKAATLLDKVRIMHGKLAMLKHENNKLRRANERLRLTDEEREAVDTAEASLMRESTDLNAPPPVRQRLGAAAATLRGLLERLGGER